MSDTLSCGHPKLSGDPCPLCRHNEILKAARLASPAPEVKPQEAPARKFTVEEHFTCIYRGAATGAEATCNQCGSYGKKVPVFACEKFGTCVVRSNTEEKHQVCMRCPTDVRTPLPGMPNGLFKPKRTAEKEKARLKARPIPPATARPSQGAIEWISTAQLVKDAALLAGQVPPDCAGVVGLPRSGMLPATVIATHLHLPLYALTPGGLHRLDGGSRGNKPGDARGTFLVVDDTVYGGNAMRRAGHRMGTTKHVTAAVYVHPGQKGAVDLHQRLLNPPHILQWNVLNSAAHTGSLACDFDGVLCQDHHGSLGDDDSCRAITLAMPPLLAPRKLAVPLIVTGRIEKFRPETEAWLARWGISFGKLVMHPAASNAERDRAGDVAQMKGREYAASRCSLFLESDERQCQAIFSLSGRPVVCVTTGKVWQRRGDQ